MQQLRQAVGAQQRQLARLSALHDGLVVRGLGASFPPGASASPRSPYPCRSAPACPVPSYRARGRAHIQVGSAAVHDCRELLRILGFHRRDQTVRPPFAAQAATHCRNHSSFGSRNTAPGSRRRRGSPLPTVSRTSCSTSVANRGAASPLSARAVKNAILSACDSPRT